MWAKFKSWILGLIFGGLALALLLWQAFSSGKKSQKSDEQEEILDNVQQAKKSRQDSDDMADADRLERMRKRSVSEYCIIDFQIKPTPEEIDKAVEADLTPLLLRIDKHDTMYEDLECKE